MYYYDLKKIYSDDIILLSLNSKMPIQSECESCSKMNENGATWECPKYGARFGNVVEYDGRRCERFHRKTEIPVGTEQFSLSRWMQRSR